MFATLKNPLTSLCALLLLVGIVTARDVGLFSRGLMVKDEPIVCLSFEDTALECVDELGPVNSAICLACVGTASSQLDDIVGVCETLRGCPACGVCVAKLELALACEAGVPFLGTLGICTPNP